MDWVDGFFFWFSGGAVQYQSLVHCMNHDYAWIGITVFLDLAVATGYMLIARHWNANQRQLRNQAARVALGRMRNIFIFCGICGYIFIPIKMYWPAWRLYDMFLVVLVYFTWRYALETRHLKVVYSELNRTEQLASDLANSREESRRKTYFLNAVSHDMRTPLNGLILQMDYATVCLEHGDAQAAREALDQAKQSAMGTASLLNGFLELARLDWVQEKPNRQIFPLATLVAETLNYLKVAANAKGLAMRAEVDPELKIITDRLKLQRILMNLVSNAVKFTPRGSVNVVARQAGSRVEIDVADTGVGIALHDQEQLFQEFYQAHNRERDRNKGFGLGLAIARRLAGQLGGDVILKSTHDRGSTFTIVLDHVIVDGGNGGRPLVQPTPADESASDAGSA